MAGLVGGEGEVCGGGTLLTGNVSEEGAWSHSRKTNDEFFA